MRVSIQTLGSLGDVMPYITTARALMAGGADVTLMAPREYTETMTAHGVTPAMAPAFSLNEWNAEAERRGTLSDPVQFFRDWGEMVVPYVEDITAHCLMAAEHADIVLGNSICAPARVAAEAYGIPYILSAQQPAISPTREIPCALMWRPWHGTWLNRAGYLTVDIAQRLMLEALKDQRRALDLRPIPQGGTRWHLGQPLARVTSVSPALIACRPEDWRSNDHLMPYPSLDVQGPDELPPALLDFLSMGAAPLHVGLGSFESDAEREQISRLLRAIRHLRLRAIISSGLVGQLPQDLTEGHFVSGHVSHPALFPLCAGVIHHGGAGTLDTALRAGTPQLIVPDRLDQFWHGVRLRQIGVAPAHITGKSTEDEMVTLLAQLTAPEMRARAQSLVSALRARNGAADLAAFTRAETERFQQSVR
ncbi:putative glycosyl transferase [Hyphomonas neptunium ATCC 15444]|uniref:Putative glycosyl transferase n=2 Tax=Hyphomonas TaxID=85 RepID=Q0BZL4_HYPNA|nr:MULTISPECIES: glycosyltransferase [Hyphomonas]ABI78677.1 putative glycosyl transferase [Hyphomonas neptunium ATCC 15444]KCZ95169.1 putative glycosyl transferase [Hyphomonas hirschiana VP5]